MLVHDQLRRTLLWHAAGLSVDQTVGSHQEQVPQQAYPEIGLLTAGQMHDPNLMSPVRCTEVHAEPLALDNEPRALLATPVQAIETLIRASMLRQE